MSSIRGEALTTDEDDSHGILPAPSPPPQPCSPLFARPLPCRRRPFSSTPADNKKRSRVDPAFSHQPHTLHSSTSSSTGSGSPFARLPTFHESCKASPSIVPSSPELRRSPSFSLF